MYCFITPPCLQTAFTEAVATGEDNRIFKNIQADSTGEVLLRLESHYLTEAENTPGRKHNATAVICG